jgi:hypothetical protein
MQPLFHVVVVLGSLFPAEAPAAAQPPADPRTVKDEKVLRSALLAVDGPALLDCLRQRVASAADERRAKVLVRQLADRSFRVRDRATAELIALGPKALPELRKALERADLETQRRAEHCIRLIDRRFAGAALAAAARLLAMRRPPGACRVLLDTFPSAPDEEVEDEILVALCAVRVRGGAADTALVAALRDRQPSRRAAAFVLARCGNSGQRTAVRGLLSDADPGVRFRAAQGLLGAGDRLGLPVLIDLLRDGPFAVREQAQAVLTLVADRAGLPVAPGADAGPDTRHARWRAWWERNRSRLSVEVAGPDELLLVTSSFRARRVARRFMTALVKGEAAAVLKETALPFLFFAPCKGGGLLTPDEMATFVSTQGERLRERKAQVRTIRVVHLVKSSLFEILCSECGRALRVQGRPAAVRFVVVQFGPAETDTMSLAVLLCGAEAKVIAILPGEVERLEKALDGKG